MLSPSLTRASTGAPPPSLSLVPPKCIPPPVSLICTFSISVRPGQKMAPFLVPLARKHLFLTREKRPAPTSSWGILKLVPSEQSSREATSSYCLGGPELAAGLAPGERQMDAHPSKQPAAQGPTTFLSSVPCQSLPSSVHFISGPSFSYLYRKDTE